MRDGGFADSNFGGDTNLMVKLSASAGFKRESYLQFDLASLWGGIQEATLQLQTLTVSTPGTQAVAWVTNNAWTENSLTWTTRPDSGAPAATWLPQAGVPATAPVTTLAQSAVAADGVLSLRIFATNSTSDGTVVYGSRESGASAPALLLAITNGTLLSATQSFWVSVFTPTSPEVAASGFTNDHWFMTINGPSGPDYYIETSTNLVDWHLRAGLSEPLLPLVWVDEGTNRPPQLFHRVRLGP